MRLTRRVFWDLAIFMISLGLVVGVVFPPFAALLGVPTEDAFRPSFVAACLLAGFLVGALNHRLSRVVVGRRLELLSARLHSVADTITRASVTGDWSSCSPADSRIAIDSDDELGDTARAFNSLLDALAAGEHFRSLVQNASDIITVIGEDGTIRYQTPSVSWVLGYPSTALVGAVVHELVHPDDTGAFTDYLLRVVADRNPPPFVAGRMQHRDGSYRHVETVGNCLLSDPAVEGVVLTTRDVSDRKELEEALRHQALHDPLTGLGNRALFNERLRDAQQATRTEAESLAVLFIDVDDLKTVNDSLGHAAGDNLLIVLARRLQGCLRPTDTVTRIGGDEFAVLLEGTGSAGRAEEVGARILASLADPVQLEDQEMVVSASVGIATTSSGGEAAADLLRAADVAMYGAKTHGKNRVEVFSPRHHAAQLARHQLSNDLERALEEEQFVLYYQPVLELRTGVVNGAEALLRWQHPERGLIGPNEFVGMAEETGLIVPIGRWILDESCRQARAWRDAGLEPRINVNLSPRQFMSGHIADDVAAALAHHGLDPAVLVLEITETLLLHDTEAMLHRLRELKGLGAELALDDFGTGYSSLAYLQRFPIDVLKIDRSFVAGIDRRSADRALVHAIAQLSHALQLRTVAEGVERAGQIAELLAVGCEYGQGYFYARPLPPTDFAAYLADPTIPRPREEPEAPTPLVRSAGQGTEAPRVQEGR